MTQRHPHSTAPGRSPSKTVAVPHIPLPAADRATASQADPLAPTFSVSVSASQHLIIKVLRRPVEFNLTAAVRVMHQQLGPRPVGQSHAQGVQREFPGDAIRHRPSDHPARVQVEHHRQVQPATASPHVGVGVGPKRPVVFRAMGFSGPPSEPDVRLSPHRALHVLIPFGSASSASRVLVTPPQSGQAMKHRYSPASSSLGIEAVSTLDTNG